MTEWLDTLLIGTEGSQGHLSMNENGFPRFNLVDHKHLHIYIHIHVRIHTHTHTRALPRAQGSRGCHWWAMSSGPDEASWEQDSQWQQWKTAVRGFSGKLQLLELCGGTGSAYIALSKLLPAGTLQLFGHWDIDGELAHWIQIIH